MSGSGLLVAGLARLFESGADWDVLWSALLGAATAAAIGFPFSAALCSPRRWAHPVRMSCKERLAKGRSEEPSALGRRDRARRGLSGTHRKAVGRAFRKRKSTADGPQTAQESGSPL